jgi:hypothetical protein
MDLDVDENGAINENEILYLADKLVKEDRIMSLKDRRIRYIETYCEDGEALDKINKRLDTAGIILKKIEKITGKGFIYG